MCIIKVNSETRCSNNRPVPLIIVVWPEQDPENNSICGTMPAPPGYCMSIVIMLFIYVG